MEPRKLSYQTYQTAQTKMAIIITSGTALQFMASTMKKTKDVLRRCFMTRLDNVTFLTTTN